MTLAPMDVGYLEPHSMAGAPSLDDMARSRRRLLAFFGAVMKKGKDYDIIKGCGDKPMLLKPGAEKLFRLFQLFPRCEGIKEVMNQEYQLMEFVYRCQAWAHRATPDGRDWKEVLVCQQDSSANAHEKAFRLVVYIEGKAKYADGRKETRLRSWAEMMEARPSILARAEKRSLVMACRVATASSDLFDTEDAEKKDAMTEQEEDEARDRAIRDLKQLAKKLGDEAWNKVRESVIGFKRTEHLRILARDGKTPWQFMATYELQAMRDAAEIELGLKKVPEAEALVKEATGQSPAPAAAPGSEAPACHLCAGLLGDSNHMLEGGEVICSPCHEKRIADGKDDPSQKDLFNQEGSK